MYHLFLFCYQKAFFEKNKNNKKQLLYRCVEMDILFLFFFSYSGKVTIKM